MNVSMTNQRFASNFASKAGTSDKTESPELNSYDSPPDGLGPSVSHEDPWNSVKLGLTYAAGLAPAGLFLAPIAGMAAEALALSAGVGMLLGFGAFAVAGFALGLSQAAAGEKWEPMNLKPNPSYNNYNPWVGPGA